MGMMFGSYQRGFMARGRLDKDRVSCPTSVVLDRLASKQLEQLKNHMRTSKSHVIRLALARLHDAMRSQFPDHATRVRKPKKENLKT
jgi:hypothetical protein